MKTVMIMFLIPVEVDNAFNHRLKIIFSFHVYFLANSLLAFPVNYVATVVLPITSLFLFNFTSNIILRFSFLIRYLIPIEKFFLAYYKSVLFLLIITTYKKSQLNQG